MVAAGELAWVVCTCSWGCETQGRPQLCMCLCQSSPCRLTEHRDPTVTESQNHRIVGVARDLCGSSSPTLYFFSYFHLMFAFALHKYLYWVSEQTNSQPHIPREHPGAGRLLFSSPFFSNRTDFGDMASRCLRLP